MTDHLDEPPQKRLKYQQQNDNSGNYLCVV